MFQAERKNEMYNEALFERVKSLCGACNSSGRNRCGTVPLQGCKGRGNDCVSASLSMECLRNGKKC